MDLVTLYVTFWLIMIVLDAIIALIIPPYMTWRRAQTKVNEIAEKFGIPITKKAYAAIQPQIKKDVEGILQKLENSIETRVNTHITNVINNDIPHMMDRKFDEICEELPTKEEFDTLVSVLRGVISSTGVAGKAAKKQERLAKIAWIKEHDPEKIKSVETLMMGKRLLGMSQGDIDQAIDLIIYTIQQEKGGQENGQEVCQVPSLQTGPHLQEVPALQEKSKPEETDMGTLSQHEGKKIIEDMVGKDIVKVIEKNKEGEKNGKEEKTRKEKS